MPEIIVPSERQIARYGFKRSLGGFEEPTANVGGITIKQQVDPREFLAKWIWNQWAMGSCTANATTQKFRYDAYLDGEDPGPLCRLGVYWGERKIEGSIGQGDTGAEGHDAYTVAKGGIPLETAWPYTWKGMEQDGAPPESYFDPAKEPSKYLDAEVAYKLTKQVVTVPQTEASIKAVLSNDQLMTYGFTVYESFESAEVTKTGIVPMPGRTEQILGGHEVLACGYLSKYPDYCLCANSWDGKESEAAGSVQSPWGLDGLGFFLMKWRYMLDKSLVSDLRTIARPL